MSDEIKTLQQLIEESDNILITSHVSPDPDALSSLLLLGTTLKFNYPEKQVDMYIEELTGGLKFLENYDKIIVKPLLDALNSQPNLIIIVDAMNFSRCTRGDANLVAQKAGELKAKLAIIDHHEPVGIEKSEVYINHQSPAAVQDIYEICFEHLKLKKPDGYGQTTMAGLYSDTGGFVYDNKRYRETFKLITELIGSGVSIEEVKNKMEQYREDCIRTLGELGSNITHLDNYTYSFISDEYIEDYLKQNKNFDDVQLAVSVFVNDLIRNVENRLQGFVVYRHPRAGKNMYSMSIRSAIGSVDVSRIAHNVGGGGHKASSGAKFPAKTIDEAVDLIKQAINDA